MQRQLGVSLDRRSRGGRSDERERAAGGAIDEGTERGRLARAVLAGGSRWHRQGRGAPSADSRGAYDRGGAPPRGDLERRGAQAARGGAAAGVRRGGLAHRGLLG